jgi:hypothetical protein
VAYEPAASSSGVEFGRKVRIMLRGLRGVVAVRPLLNPLRYGFYSVQLLSHKVLRRQMAVPLLVLLVTSWLLWSAGTLYQMAAVCQTALYAAAVCGLVLHNTRHRRRTLFKLFTLPLYFCVVNAASLVATWRLLRGQRIVLWEPQRSKPPVGKVPLIEGDR